jgi:hypothetical protein
MQVNWHHINLLFRTRWWGKTKVLIHFCFVFHWWSWWKRSVRFSWVSKSVTRDDETRDFLADRKSNRSIQHDSQIENNHVIYILTLVKIQLLNVWPAHSHNLWIRSIIWKYLDAVLDLRLINVQFTLWNFYKATREFNVKFSSRKRTKVDTKFLQEMAHASSAPRVSRAISI